MQVRQALDESAMPMSSASFVGLMTTLALSVPSSKWVSKGKGRTILVVASRRQKVRLDGLTAKWWCCRGGLAKAAVSESAWRRSGIGGEVTCEQVGRFKVGIRKVSSPRMNANTTIHSPEPPVDSRGVDRDAREVEKKSPQRLE